MKQIINQLEKHFTITTPVIRKDSYLYMFAEKNEAVALITHLRDIQGFSHLVFFTAVDFPETGDMVLHYMLHNYDLALDLGVKVKIDRKDPQMESIHHLWAAAGTYQRELREMYGVDFPGSPRLEESFALEGWMEIPPMRRDFDSAAYSKKTFFARPGRKTYDPQTEMKKRGIS